jgi:hypothetical protein
MYNSGKLYRDRKQSNGSMVGCWRKGLQSESDGGVHYLDHGDGFPSENIYQIVSDSTLTINYNKI